MGTPAPGGAPRRLRPGSDVTFVEGEERSCIPFCEQSIGEGEERSCTPFSVRSIASGELVSTLARRTG